MSAERGDATVGLPNAPAYVVAGISLAATLATPIALVLDGRGLFAALEGRYLHTFVLFTVLGALILYRRPGLVIGWLLVAIGGLDAVTRLRDLYELFGLAGRPGLPTIADVDDVIGWTVVVSIAGLAVALPQLFPDGRLVSDRWRWLAWFGAVATVLTVVGLLVRFVLLPGAGGPDWPVGVAFALFGLAMLLSLAPVVVRFRRSSGTERRQLEWVFYALAVSVPLVLAGLIPGLPEAVGGALSLPALVVVPGAITVAVLRYRLYDIDVVISRTLLVAGLAGFITVAYVAIVVGLGSVVGGSPSSPNPTLSLVATAVVAVAFQPVRHALQRVANRLVYGRRATAYDVLGGFATRIGAAEPSADTLERLAELLADGTGADPARVWLRVGSGLRPAATWPRRTGAATSVGLSATTMLPDADLAVPVRDGGELLGVLTVAKPRGERVTDADTDLLERLAAASGVLLRNLRLDAELAQRLDDLEASRRRLVTAQDDSRRRIETALADGPRGLLVALRGQLDDLTGAADPDVMPRTATLLARLVPQADGALATLDGLAAGVYPSRLASEGLAAALAEQAGRAGLPVTVHACGIARHTPDTEAAVYFSVLEALQNVAKYAAASSAHIRLDDGGGRLRFEVTDDGAGFDPAARPPGSGLQGMADRLDTVGGSLTVSSTPGGGTTVVGEVPVAAPADGVTAPTGHRPVAGAPA